MTGELAIAPMLVALVTGTVLLVFRSRPVIQRGLALFGTVVYGLVVAMLVHEVVFSSGGGPIVYQLGGWQAPFGITLIADGLSVFMLALTACIALYSVIFSLRYLDDATTHVYYHPLFQFLLLGASGAFLTADLFNLFVWFEVMLMASYIFVGFYGNARHTAAAMRYLVLNIIGGILMLLAIGGLYATTGTLNLADMAQLVADPETDMAPVVGISALIFVTFALKAGLVPFQFWVPSAYRAAPLPVVAMFAGVTKKVGIYAIIRLYFTVFGDANISTSVPLLSVESPLAFLAPILLTMGILSIIVGGVGALTRDSLDGLLAYSSIGQVGFIAVPVAIAAATTSESLRHLGILAGLVFALHHALTKALLFLSAAVIQDGTGTTTFAKLGGLGDRTPLFSVVFLVGGLSLVGIPPLAGFFGKFLVFDTAARQFTNASAVGGIERAVAAIVVAALLGGAMLTILYSTQAWLSGFWGGETTAVADGTFDVVQIGILASFAAIILAVGIGFEPIFEMADTAATAALDTEGYVDAVDPASGEAVGTDAFEAASEGGESE